MAEIPSPVPCDLEHQDYQRFQEKGPIKDAQRPWEFLIISVVILLFEICDLFIKFFSTKGGFAVFSIIITVGERVELSEEIIVISKCPGM